MKKIHIITFLIIALGIYLLISTSSDLSTYSTFEMAIENGQQVKIAGELAKDKEMYYNPEKDPNYFSFYLVDPDGMEQQVILTKPKPQDFELSEQVVVTGRMQDNIFVATDVLMKCPSKYKDEEIALRKNS